MPQISSCEYPFSNTQLCASLICPPVTAAVQLLRDTPFSTWIRLFFFSQSLLHPEGASHMMEEGKHVIHDASICTSECRTSSELTRERRLVTEQCAKQPYKGILLLRRQLVRALQTALSSLFHVTLPTPSAQPKKPPSDAGYHAVLGSEGASALRQFPPSCKVPVPEHFQTAPLHRKGPSAIGGCAMQGQQNLGCTGSCSDGETPHAAGGNYCRQTPPSVLVWGLNPCTRLTLSLTLGNSRAKCGLWNPGAWLGGQGHTMPFSLIAVLLSV